MLLLSQLAVAAAAAPDAVSAVVVASIVAGAGCLLILLLWCVTVVCIPGFVWVCWTRCMGNRVHCGACW